MSFLKFTYLLFVCLLLNQLSFAQKKSVFTPHQVGEILIQFRTNVNPKNFTLKYSALRADNTEKVLRLIRPIAPEIGIYLFAFDENIDERKILEDVRRDPNVMTAQFNHLIESRATTPNDSLFSSQWDMQIIEAQKVWDVTTGGYTSTGDTIVVAILEPDGFEPKHPDLFANVWYNKAELPNNGKDDDNNGYVDDYYGLNLLKLNDQHSVESFPHGTNVAGIIGAKGNNTKGVTGVNWNIKLMLLSSTKTEANIIEAYNYALKMRKLYNETSGAEGAFVVSTNASLGIDKRQPEDFPLWCAMYDKLGEVGILSVSSTTNKDNTDVDIDGDMPSACGSNYLVTVTNMTREDKKNATAGYGKKSIDLGAPGDASFNIARNKTYGLFTGTSAAAPHVAGAIALLYSTPVNGWTSFVKQKPEQAALKMKDFILGGVKKLDVLSNLVVSGGRLNMAGSLALMQNSYTPVSGLNISFLAPNPAHSTVTVNYSTATFGTHTMNVFNELGQLVHEEIFSPVSLFDTKVTFSVEGWASGVYFVRLRDAKNERVVKKLVVY